MCCQKVVCRSLTSHVCGSSLFSCLPASFLETFSASEATHTENLHLAEILRAIGHMGRAAEPNLYPSRAGSFFRPSSFRC